MLFFRPDGQTAFAEYVAFLSDSRSPLRFCNGATLRLRFREGDFRLVCDFHWIVTE